MPQHRHQYTRCHHVVSHQRGLAAKPLLICGWFISQEGREDGPLLRWYARTAESPERIIWTWLAGVAWSGLISLGPDQMREWNQGGVLLFVGFLLRTWWLQVFVRDAAAAAPALPAAGHVRAAGRLRRLRGAHLLHVLRLAPRAARTRGARRWRPWCVPSKN